MKSSQPHAMGAVFWWVVWITLTIVSFFAAVWFWTPIIARKFGPVHETHAAIIWLIAVFGSWLICLVPLIILMYSKVDKAYEDARIKREQASNRFKSLNIDRDKRLLPIPLRDKLKGLPETIESGHLVTVLLKNGEKIPYVFIGSGSEILGIYDHSEMPFKTSEIADILPEDLSQPLPRFLTTKWLRLDGVTAD